MKTHESQISAPAASEVNLLRRVEAREWWLWGFAVVVTLLLTGAILSFAFPNIFSAKDHVYLQNLREWVRGLACLVHFREHCFCGILIDLAGSNHL